MTICDRIAVLDEGVVQQVGTPIDLYDRPVNRFVAEFVGSLNLFEGELRREGEALRFVGATLGEVRLPASLKAQPAPRVQLAFRPHAVSFGADAAGDGVELHGTIDTVEFLGEFLRYEVRVRDAIVLADQAHARGHEPLEKGRGVALHVSPSDLRILG